MARLSSINIDHVLTVDIEDATLLNERSTSLDAAPHATSARL